MRVKFTEGKPAGGIYRWYIDNFLNTQRGPSLNTIWFLSISPPKGNGEELLKKSYNFLNEEGESYAGFEESWRYMTDMYGDENTVQGGELSKNTLVFLLSKEVTIPGVSLDVSQTPYPATGGSGVITGSTITGARRNNDHISIEMYLTDFSFPNVILRPWIRALSIYGMTDVNLRGQIVFTQLTKRNTLDANGEWRVSNIITLENAYPVSVPSYNMNYQGADIDKTMSVEWGYDIINVKNRLFGDIDKNRFKDTEISSKSWGESVASTGGEIEEPLEDTRRRWNEPDRKYIELRKKEKDHGISPVVNPDGSIGGQRVEDYDKIGTGNIVEHWTNSNGTSNPAYKVSKAVSHRLWEEGLDVVRYYPNETPHFAIGPFEDDTDYTDSWVPYTNFQIKKQIQIKNTFGTGSHDAVTGNEDTVMLNGWPFALHHYIPAFYNLFDFLTKNPKPKPNIVLDKRGDTPSHNGSGNINESMSSNDDSTITGNIAKKDAISTSIDDTPYEYDSLGITKIGEVPPNDSNITGDIGKKDNENVKTPDTPGARLTVPVIQENVPYNDHVNDRLSYDRNVNTPTDDHITGGPDAPNTKSTSTHDSRRGEEQVLYTERADNPDKDYRNPDSAVGYKNINTEPQGRISTGEIQSYVPRETTNGAGIGELYSEIETPTNDVPLFAEVAKKIIINSDSLSVNQ